VILSGSLRVPVTSPTDISGLLQWRRSSVGMAVIIGVSRFGLQRG
jgi:hypothetical protein